MNPSSTTHDDDILTESLLSQCRFTENRILEFEEQSQLVQEHLKISSENLEKAKLAIEGGDHRLKEIALFLKAMELIIWEEEQMKEGALQHHACAQAHHLTNTQTQENVQTELMKQRRSLWLVYSII